ncbi:hypothetical protein Misp01_76670 [Microtetraspora sp. NBRC 13810]|uniref:CU044_5270 family protein n=1 Tax=Microtetraspora sp. NBRC 13810 TaxID=3030990 RepID=UPI0024A13AFD|nr:CU044_5270 family protein [Microtetraspora sp. NBRC 13810]GLW12539.1 hypothetical protein Misp01_76670 [Microtetraspora sp. NBRC 13810]
MDEVELLNRLREEVPMRPDLRAEERRLLAGIRGGSPAPRRRPALRLRWGVALAGVLAAVVITSQFVGVEGPGDRSPVARPPGAVVVLENAALVAARAKPADIRPDQWFYVKESQHMPGGDLPTFELWSRMDGERSALRQEGSELKIGDGEPDARTNPARTQRELADLPVDPDALLAHFRASENERMAWSMCLPECPPGTEADARAFGTIGWYMKYGPVIPPDRIATMYRALAKIPNVTIEENATDLDGRKGIGVVFDTGDAGKHYFILDAVDYHYLGNKSVRDGEAFGMSLLASGIVDEPGELP